MPLTAELGRNILGANGIVAGGIGLGTGTALASRIRGTDQVSVVFFGDGAAARGPFHEGILFGSLWKLFATWMKERQWLDDEEDEAIQASVKAEIGQSVAFAEASPLPGPEDVATDVLDTGWRATA